MPTEIKDKDGIVIGSEEWDRRLMERLSQRAADRQNPGDLRSAVDLESGPLDPPEFREPG